MWPAAVVALPASLRPWPRCHGATNEPNGRTPLVYIMSTTARVIVVVAAVVGLVFGAPW